MKTQQKKSKDIKWHQRAEVWGSILLVTCSAASVIMMMFPEKEVLYRIGAIVGVLVGLVKTIHGLLKGYRANNLAKSITTMMDKIPDSITGKKGGI